jgi:hypothetical protein
MKKIMTEPELTIEALHPETEVWESGRAERDQEDGLFKFEKRMK